LTRFRARGHASRVGTIPPLPRHRLVRFRLFNRAMFKTIVPLLSVLLFSLFPVPAQPQCNDQLCQNLQAILDEAVTDYRGIERTRPQVLTSRSRELLSHAKCRFGQTMCRCISATPKFQIRIRKNGMPEHSRYYKVSTQHGISKSAPRTPTI
jgi:hypothetical protein